ncbi:hypothetical protein LXL04_021002 [Taraxacum kok-saghyz]
MVGEASVIEIMVYKSKFEVKMEHLIIIHTQPRAINHLSVPRRGGQPNSAIIVHNSSWSMFKGYIQIRYPNLVKVL